MHWTYGSMLKVPLSGSHAAGLSAALDLLRPQASALPVRWPDLPFAGQVVLAACCAVQAALVFVCPNAGETVKSVVQERCRFARVRGVKRQLQLEHPGAAIATWSCTKPCHSCSWAQDLQTAGWSGADALTRLFRGSTLVWIRSSCHLPYSGAKTSHIVPMLSICAWQRVRNTDKTQQGSSDGFRQQTTDG